MMDGGGDDRLNKKANRGIDGYHKFSRQGEDDEVEFINNLDSSSVADFEMKNRNVKYERLFTFGVRRDSEMREEEGGYVI